MNFFGHCVVAGIVHPDESSSFALGSMAPDFAVIAGVRFADPASPNQHVVNGIAFHHATDAAFHRHPVVVRLMRELFDSLLGAGVERGRSRLVAHIAIELLLDGEWSKHEPHRVRYCEAIASEIGEVYLAEGHGSAHQLEGLMQRLRRFGAPVDLQHSDGIVARLTRMLAARSRFALSVEDCSKIGDTLDQHRVRCEVAATNVLSAMAAQLSQAPQMIIS